MLEKIKKGQQIRPPRIVIHGGEKVGKSTFAAQSSNPIFVAAEEGAEEIGVDRFPVAKSFAEYVGNLNGLLAEKHDYETVVVDTGDWLERLIHSKVAADAGVKDISEIGYGKGYRSALGLWSQILGLLDQLRDHKGMSVIIINHTAIKRFDSPEVEPYDRYVMKLHADACALITEWADVIGYATKDTYVKKEDVGFNKKVARAISTGNRVLRLEGAPAFVAGNRYGLPATIELKWSAFVDAFAKSKILKPAEGEPEAAA